jgi:hypothetical protein
MCTAFFRIRCAYSWRLKMHQQMQADDFIQKTALDISRMPNSFVRNAGRGYALRFVDLPESTNSSRKSLCRYAGKQSAVRSGLADPGCRGPIRSPRVLYERSKQSSISLPFIAAASMEGITCTWYPVFEDAASLSIVWIRSPQLDSALGRESYEHLRKLPNR